MKRKSKRSPESFPCPHCGAAVEVGATACRQCGSDAETGWSESYNSGYDSGYGDDEFDYDEFVEREFPSHAKRSWKWSIKRIVMIVVVALLVIALLRPFLWW